MKEKYLLLKLLLLIQLMAFFVIETNAHDKHETFLGKCEFSCAFDKNNKEKLLRHVIPDANDLPSVSQKIVISPNNLFAIHYDTVGHNAPSPIDLNKNGISDFVDSVCYYFERAYRIQVNEIGYISPIPDRNGRGTPQYDVYLWDLGNSDDDTSDVNYDQGGFYGYTLWQLSDIINQNGNATRTYSYIVIDNDFSPTDSIRPKYEGKPRKAFTETGINALKITASHEFQHAIQLMYFSSSSTFMEMCAVAMEFRLYPETKDYFQYVSNIFNHTETYTFGKDDPQSGYGFSIFARYLLLNYGDQSLKRVWELVSQDINCYKALDMSLNELGTSLAIEWEKFLDWCYFTGNRAIEGKYFPDAKKLPEISFFSNLTYSPPSVLETKSLKPFEIRASRFNFEGMENSSDDTLDVMLGNYYLYDASSGGESKCEYEIQVTGESASGSEKLNGINYYYKDSYNNQKMTIIKHIRPGTVTNGIDYAYPNPFNPNDDLSILFPAPDNSEIYQAAELNVYTSDMLPVYSAKLKVLPNNKNRVVMWNNIPADISNGIYIFGVNVNDNIKLGKFSVIRK